MYDVTTNPGQAVHCADWIPFQLEAFPRVSTPIDLCLGAVRRLLMARGYAQIVTSLWRPEADFRDLTPAAQHMYFLLNTQADISAAGVLALRIRWWASCSKGSTPASVTEALNELSDAGMIVVDKLTEELLVRSFVRHDKGYGNEKRRPAIRDAACSVLSPLLRRVLANELVRLGLTVMASEVDPESVAAGVVDVASDGALDRASDRASVAAAGGRLAVTARIPENPGLDGVSDRASDGPSDRASDGVSDGVSGSNRVVGTYVSGLSPHPSTLNQGAASHAMPPLPSEFCRNHPAGTDVPCGACGRARSARDAAVAARAKAERDAAVAAREAERVARAEAIARCQLCGDDGYRLTTDGPGAVCNHQPLNPGGRARAFAELNGGKP